MEIVLLISWFLLGVVIGLTAWFFVRSSLNIENLLATPEREKHHSSLSWSRSVSFGAVVYWLISTENALYGSNPGVVCLIGLGVWIVFGLISYSFLRPGKNAELEQQRRAQIPAQENITD